MKEPTQNTKTRRRHPLVIGHLERISYRVFAEFSPAITALVGGRHGVYALYRKDRLYYIGLASNLKNRIKNHLNDRHAGN